MYSDIDDIVTYGNGYDWETVYDFPIWLRNWTYKRIEERFKKKNEEVEAQNNVITNTTNTQKLAKPPQSNNVYNSKVPKK